VKIVKLATCFAAGIILSGLFCVSVKADSVILVEGGAGVPVTYKIAGSPASHGTILFSITEGVLTVNLADPKAATNVGFVFDFDSISNVTVAQKGGGNSFDLASISAVGSAHAEAIGALFRKTIALTLHEFSGNVVIHFKKGNAVTEKPIGCLGCSVSVDGVDGVTMPEPGSLVLLGSGLFGVSAMIRRQFRRKRN